VPAAPASPKLSAPFKPLATAARYYQSQPERDRTPPPEEPLRRAILEDARAAAWRLGRPSPEGDARLDWAMTDIASQVRGDEVPAREVVDFLLEHYGLVEPAPHFLLHTASLGGEKEVREHARDAIAETMKAYPIARLGVGIVRERKLLYVSVALQEKHLELLTPVPRQLPKGGQVAVAARIDPAFAEPVLVITGPDGTVQEEKAPLRAGVLTGAVRCRRNGRHQVEILASDKGGPAVLANFPVHCGVEPPNLSPGAAGVLPGSTTPEAAERELLALINRDRAHHALPPLVADAKLAEIARAHSREMAKDDRVGHVSPRTGSSLDRVLRAGLRPGLVLENVGRGYSAEEAETGFLASPGHRSNILDRRARRVGVGVVFGPRVTGTTPMFVTQLFTD
jgi:uncharacterized protein YkwD